MRAVREGWLGHQLSGMVAFVAVTGLRACGRTGCTTMPR